jgi:hypothetical protein
MGEGPLTTHCSVGGAPGLERDPGLGSPSSAEWGIFSIERWATRWLSCPPWRGKLNVRSGARRIGDTLSPRFDLLGTGTKTLHTNGGVHLPIYPSPRSFSVPIAPVRCPMYPPSLSRAWLPHNTSRRILTPGDPSRVDWGQAGYKMPPRYWGGYLLRFAPPFTGRSSDDTHSRPAFQGMKRVGLNHDSSPIHRRLLGCTLGGAHSGYGFPFSNKRPAPPLASLRSWPVLLWRRHSGPARLGC